MTNLNAQQSAKVSSWVAGGATLAEVQARLTTEFGLHLTYMDVRFLVDDLDLSLVEKEEPKKEEAASEPSASAESEPSGGSAPAAPAASGAEPTSQAASGVAITIDAVIAPGAMVSGSVKFSDGAVGTWSLDQMGQLGFNPPTPGYRPSQADVADFQVKLDTALRQAGY
ncbi:MAG: hypothetical protein ACO3ND_04045 [Opitutales bacterium]